MKIYSGFKYLNGEYSLEQTETSLRLTIKSNGDVNIHIEGVLQPLQAFC